MGAYHFYQPVDIRYGDLDPQGHVNNATYLTYLEQARIGYLRHLGLWIPAAEGNPFLNIGIILADAHITFRAPILFGQDIQVGVRVTRLGNKSLSMEYCIEEMQARQELAAASTVLVTYDYRTSATILIPDHWRKRIQEFENITP